MRNLYTKNGTDTAFRQMFRKLWQISTLAVMFVLMANIGMAQIDMTWTGAENDRFDNENNWEPAGSIEGNNLIIPLQYDTLGNQLFPTPVLTGSQSYSVYEVTVTQDENDSLEAHYVIDLASDTVTFTFTNTSIQYNSSGIIINGGHVYFNDQKRLDAATSWFEMNGGILEMKSYFIMRDRNDMSTGGHFTFNGGTIKLNGGFHDRVNKTINQWTITGDAVLEVAGNYGSYEDDIASGWMSGGDDYSVVRSYDAISDWTTYHAIPSTSIVISNSSRQVLKINEVTADTIVLVPTNAVVDATTYQWEYRKKGEDTYTAFSDAAATTDSYAPQFTSSGTFYVSCLVDGERTENEVEFYVVSDQISFAPAEFPIQFVRLNESGTQMTAEFATTPTTMEWKHSTVPGGPYESFDPAVTTNTINPTFTELGNNYVVMEAVIDGNTHISTELLYNVEENTTAGKGLTWTGLVSEDGTDPANWDPVASPYKNSVAIGAFDSLSTLPYPLYSPEGNDTLSTFWVGPGAKMTIDIQDTLNIRGGWQQAQGELIIMNGTITNKGYFRLDKPTGDVQLYNDSKMIIESLLMGDRNTDGGIFQLKDNSVLHCINLPGRVAPDTLQSVIYVSDNATIEYEGDQRSTVGGWIENAKIVCPEEGFEPYVLYDETTGYTLVKARNTNAFAIADDSKTYTTANFPIESSITLVNVDNVTGWEWKWSTSVVGPWNSFDPAVTDEASFNPSFAESGTYYIVAESSDGVVTSNMKPVVVIDLGITPAEPQTIELETDGDTLMAVIPSEFTVTAIAWYYREQGSEEYFQTGVEDSIFIPNFATKGIYEVFYGVEVQDEFGVQYFLQSSSVEITVGNVGVADLFLGHLKVYPNPTTGKFYIDGNMDKDYTVEIFDITGSSVYKERFDAYTQKAIELNGKGVYIVKVQSNDGAKIGRLVVK